MSSSGINIRISGNAAKWIGAGAIVLGACYLIYKLLEDKEKLATLPEEAETFSKLPELSPSTFDELGLHPRVKESARISFETGQYVSAVRSASVTLFDIIREKSGLDSDATNLVKLTFRGEPKKGVMPRLKFKDSEPAHVTNMGDGYINMLEGFAKTVRKIHMHASIIILKEKALQEISLACYLASLVEEETIQLIDVETCHDS